VDVTADLDRGLELEKDGLADKDLARLGAQVLDLVLLKLDAPAGAVATDWGMELAGYSEFGMIGDGGQRTRPVRLLHTYPQEGGQ
jgi:hypothetical protein